MHIKRRTSRAVAMLLALATMFSLLVSPASAAVPPDNSGSIADGSSSVTIDQGSYIRVLNKSTGGTIGGSSWTYTSDKGLTGPAYCVNWGLNAVSPTKRLEITGRYDRNPQTMGAFANGYPQRTLAQFKELHPEIPGIANLTEDEYAYATQLAIWATCGQLAVAGTSFTSGRATLVRPTSDAQQIRVYNSVVEILKLAAGWTKQIYTGMYFHMEKDRLGNTLNIYDENGLEGAAEKGLFGLQKETINGTEYYTRLMYIDSATSTYPNDYEIYVYSMDAPAGTIFVNQNNQVFETRDQWGATMYEVPTPKAEATNLNANGSAYTGAFKICIPCDNAGDAGSIKIEAYTVLTQFNLYLAYNPTASEQSYIIADPAYVGRFAESSITWNTTEEVPETASLQVQKVDGAANPLEGAEFTLTGSKGTTRTGTSDQNGMVVWTDLPADEDYVLTESKAPAGFTIVAPRNITLTAGQTAHVTVQDSTEKHFWLKKIDAQNGSALQGAVYKFEKIDGDFVTTATTGFDGMIEFAGEELPFGSYRVSELQPPEGYLPSDEVQTVHWDGTKDVTLTFRNVREITVVLSKIDGKSGISLPGASFDVFLDGEYITSVTTDDAGEARVTLEKEGYVEFVETAAPSGYRLDRTRHGIHVDPYDPAIEEDPVITVENFENPSLRIIKVDRKNNYAPLEGVTFEVFRDGESLGHFVTDSEGRIELFDQEPGTFRVVEVDTGDPGIILSGGYQEIELKAGDPTRELVFFNDHTPGLKLVKVDSSDYSKVIANAVFEIKAVDGSYGPEEFRTDVNGEIDLSAENLPAGAYVVTEKSCPGYVVDDAQRIIYLDPNEDAEFVFTNSKLPSLELIKTSADGTPLEGVSFRLAKIEDGSYYLDRTTDSEGRIVWDSLDPGVYSLREISTLPNHILDPKEYHIEVFPGENSTKTLSNDVRPNLYIHKRDAATRDPIPGTVYLVKAADGHTIDQVEKDETGTAVVENLLPMVVEIVEVSVPEPYLLAEESQFTTLYPNEDSHVYFENSTRPVIEILKLNEITQDPLENVPVQVWYASNNTATGEYNDLGVFYTDSEGRIVLSDPDLSLRDGWFRIEELEAPKGFSMTESSKQEAFVPAGESHTFRVYNRPNSAICVWKYDSETGAAIEGAVFQVRYLSGNTSGTGGTVIGTYRTSINGSFTVTDCEPGTYIIEELSSDGSHVIDTPPQTVYLSGEEQETVQVFFGNSPMGSLLIKKVSSSDNSPISDVQFFVTESDGTVVGDGNGYFTTDSAGTILIEGIEPGTTLIVKETRTKEGFLLDDTPQTAQIKAGQTVTLEFRNQPKGNLIVHKLSSTDKQPLEGVQFKITYADGSYLADENGHLSSNGLYWTNSEGQIVLSNVTGTLVVTEVQSIEGYTIDPDTQSQTVVVNPDDTQELWFYNDPVGGLELIKVNESKTSERIPNTTFEIRRMDDALVDTITTDRNGRAFLALEDGSYYAVEVEANSDFILDSTPHYFEIKGGNVYTLRVTNAEKSGILIHKVDQNGEGIYGVKFLLYDEDRNPIGEFVSDNNGYVHITADDLPDGANTSGRFYLRELEVPDGYIIDEEYKTVYVRPGHTAEIEWVNAAITAQIQIWKKSADDNPINGFPAGTPLEGAVFEIYNKANVLVDTIESNSRGLAVSKPLPLGRYIIKEVSSPQFYSINSEEVTVYLEHEGQIVQMEWLNESVYTNVSIDKSGYTQVVPGQEIRYTFQDIGNNSTVPLSNFYWRDTLPTDAVRLDKIITGTYSARLNYKVVYQTNLNNTQRVLADNLNTQQNYTLDASAAALGLASNEYVTQVTFLFGQVPAGFKQVETPYIYCDVLSGLAHEYRFANKCDVGGMWQNQWIQATDRWVTIIYRGGPTPTLPRTGY